MRKCHPIHEVAPKIASGLTAKALRAGWAQGVSAVFLKRVTGAACSRLANIAGQLRSS
jgi:hypothetical protein